MLQSEKDAGDKKIISLLNPLVRISDIDLYSQVTEHSVCISPTNETDGQKSAVVRIGTQSSRVPMSKARILKNLFVLCFGFLLVFTAYEALANLQSTMNSQKGLGTTALAVVYAFLIISSFSLPSFMIKKLGCKNTLILCAIGFAPYVAANFNPTWETLIPTAILCGIASGPFWSARSTYVNEISFWYATLTNFDNESAASLFFGICCMFYQGAQIWGNVISYYVLKKTDFVVSHTPEGLAVCGASFCSEEITTNLSNPNLDPPSQEQRYMLTGIYLSICLLSAFVLWVFLDTLEVQTRSEIEEKKTALHDEEKTSFLFAAFNQLRNRDQLLVVPVTLYFGLSDGFFFSSYTKAYIACAWGVYHVGYVMVVYGASSSAFSALSGPMVKLFGRIPVFVSSALVNLAMYIALLAWKPNPDEQVVFFLIAAAWGYGDAIWWSQIAALYGTMFKKNEAAAFSNFYFWNSSGFLIAYAIENVFCTYLKIYVLICVLFSGMAGLLIVQLKPNEESTDDEASEVSDDRKLDVKN